MGSQKGEKWQTKLQPLPSKGLRFQAKFKHFFTILFQIQKYLPRDNLAFRQKQRLL